MSLGVFELSVLQKKWLKKNGWVPVERIARGFSSVVWKVRSSDGKVFALKAERLDSPRKQMVEKESVLLLKANALGIGPRVLQWDEKARVVLMEWVEGVPFGKWVFSDAVSKPRLLRVVKSVFRQAKKLDALGLDHGQLAGKGANILVGKRLKPVLIDFEKGSLNRKTHNVSQLQSFLFRNPHAAIAKRVRAKLGEKTVKSFLHSSVQDS